MRHSSGASTVAEPTDEALVAAFVDGDSGAFDALVDRYDRRVFAICYRYFGDPSDAEDAAQDAFLALLRRAGTFTGASAFSTWMYRVATNACNDLARKRARRPRAADAEVAEVVDRHASHPGVEQQLDARDLDPELARALRDLDPATREAVVLHDLYGVPYADIAERSGVAVGTVKSRIHRGHAKLADALRQPASDAYAGPDGGNPSGRHDLLPPTP